MEQWKSKPKVGDWWYDEIEEELWHQTDRGYIKYVTKVGDRRRRPKYKRFIETTSRSNASIGPRTMCFKRGQHVYMTGTSEESVGKRNPKTHNLKERINAMGDEAWTIQEYAILDYGSIISNSLQNTEVDVVSDGSYKEGKGTTSWVMGSENKIVMRGRCRVP